MPKITFEMQAEGTAALRTVAIGEVGDAINIVVSVTPDDSPHDEDFDVTVDIHSAAPAEATAEMLELAAKGIRAALAAQS